MTLRLTLGRKFGSLAAVTAVVAVLFSTALATRSAETAASISFSRRAHTLAATIGASYLGPILAGGTTDINLGRLLDVVLDREADLVRVTVFDQEGIILEDRQRARPGRQLTLNESILVPGPTGDIRLGKVRAVFSFEAFDRQVWALRLRLLLIALAVGTGALVAAAVFARTVTRPVRDLEAAARRLHAGDLSARAPVSSTDEIGELAASFNVMAAEIEEDRRRLERSYGEITEIQDFTTQLAAELTREKLQVLIVRTFKKNRVAEVSKVSLFLHDEAAETLFFAEGDGIDERARDLRFKKGEGIVGRILVDRSPILIEDIRKQPGYVGRPDAPPESLLALPLLTKDRVVGVVCLNNRTDGKPFTDRDQTVLDTLARSAAIALENARLYEMAITDGLTGLFIHRYFQQRLDGELARTRRYGHKLSLLMLDIDRFKTCNDTYGHQVGDGVLVGLARILRRNLREADIPCRYGGEEFSLILPDTDEAGGRTVAERIRKDCEGFEFQGPAGALKITVSIGAATFRDGQTKDEMIFEADKALYAAKGAGRNRVFHFHDISTVQPRNPRGAA